mmetsp:Transcript_2570/g.3594  ORF Transcript_2570/g.3594 Transcript_2570/m.3594 type:complete len:208 (+) Transcript_2570:173-796(+)|eukprot:CAMPEP_0116066522 /NCGR_PEP_ID=MMETSP0322-20121206/10427_1 /TAXON_ID=163516 /ORGANISM="Leptocylindrus danicus var. apora, Strain B651" /LENGTH=207 /DNA_ID=CAMNT_0003553081 /DNA_START=83 /DNA_END=706 /DNA_ORIENTATION=+
MGGYSSKVVKPPSNNSITAIDRAMLDLKNSRDRLKKYRTKLQADDQKLLLKAKELKRSKKEQSALNLLKLRKYKMREVDKVEQQLLNVYEMIQTIDTKQQEAFVLDAINQGTEALKVLHSERSIDDVIKIMEDAQEEAEIENEINNIIGGGITDDFDIEELEAELVAMETSIEKDAVLPDVPTNALPDIKPVNPVVNENTEKIAVAS